MTDYAKPFGIRLCGESPVWGEREGLGLRHDEPPDNRLFTGVTLASPWRGRQRLVVPGCTGCQPSFCASRWARRCV